MLAPPVVHEPFTLLPCPRHAVTTLDMEGCAEHAIVRTDATINALARQIFGLLETADGKRAFVRSEARWLAYRRDSCAAEASKYAGGTLSPLLDAQCQADRSATHVRDLRSLARTLKTP
jgi:uncharacterized protein YecT (DUF1311 family)